MAIDTDPRFGIDRWGASTDLWPGRTGWRNLLSIITSKAAIALQSTASSRPAAGISGRIHKALDTGRYSWDDGTTWQEISPIGDGTAGQGPTTFSAAGAAGAAGSSRVAARVDHSHPQPPWPIDTWRMPMAADAGCPAGSERPIFTAAINSAPAGLYLLGFTAIVGTQAVDASAYTQNYLQLNAGGVGQGRIRADCDRKVQPYSYVTPFQWAGGAMALQIRSSPLSTALQFYGTDNAGAGSGAGTNIWASYLGPTA